MHMICIISDVKKRTLFNQKSYDHNDRRKATENGSGNKREKPLRL